jgi:hypothetical protein
MENANLLRESGAENSKRIGHHGQVQLNSSWGSVCPLKGSTVTQTKQGCNGRRQLRRGSPVAEGRGQGSKIDAKADQYNWK